MPRWRRLSELCVRAATEPAFAALLLLLSLAVVSWPFLVHPAPSLEEAWRHLFAAWGGLVAVLALLAWCLGRRGDREPP